MTTYTGIADANGDFIVPFSASYTSGQKVTVTAEKEGATKSIELFAPSDTTGGGVIQFSGTLTNFPNNIGVVTISGEITAIPDYAFAGNGTASQQNAIAKGTGLVISLGTQSIGMNAFQYWRSMVTLVLAATLTSVGASAFAGCIALKEANFPDGVTSIGASIMSGCSACTNLIVGSGIKAIPTNAFSTMTSLTKAEFKGQITSMAANSCNSWTSCSEIIMHSITPPTITSTTFTGLKTGCIFKVPATSVAAYQAAANWSAYASQIQAI